MADTRKVLGQEVQDKIDELENILKKNKSLSVDQYGTRHPTSQEMDAVLTFISIEQVQNGLKNGNKIYSDLLSNDLNKVHQALTLLTKFEVKNVPSVNQMRLIENVKLEKIEANIWMDFLALKAKDIPDIKHHIDLLTIYKPFFSLISNNMHWEGTGRVVGKSSSVGDLKKIIEKIDLDSTESLTKGIIACLNYCEKDAKSRKSPIISLGSFGKIDPKLNALYTAMENLKGDLQITPNPISITLTKSADIIAGSFTSTAYATEEKTQSTKKIFGPGGPSDTDL